MRINSKIIFQGNLFCTYLGIKFDTLWKQHGEPCPQSYTYFDGTCYGVEFSQGAVSFPKAEVVCLPHPDDPYEKRLAWTENLEHWDFMSFLAKGKFFSDTMFSKINMEFFDNIINWCF